MAEPRFSVEDWVAVFGQGVPYPTGLPDLLVRDLASLQIYLRGAPKLLEDGLSNVNRLTAFMPLSLLSGTLKRMARDVEARLQLAEKGLPYQGPGVDEECQPPERQCPKTLDPVGISWIDGCWCYRNPEQRREVA